MGNFKKIMQKYLGNTWEISKKSPELATVHHHSCSAVPVQAASLNLRCVICGNLVFIVYNENLRLITQDECLRLMIGCSYIIIQPQGGDIHTNTYTQPQTFVDKATIRNQVYAWFKNKSYIEIHLQYSILYIYIANQGR